MINETIGLLGHFSIIITFVFAGISTYGFIQAARASELEKDKWLKFSRIAFFLQAGAVLSTVVCLFYIINNHLFEYHYAFSHSSKVLPVEYQISCFWEGQEGSFLLWIFWNVVLGIIVIFTNKYWEAPVMSVFSLVQCVLASMILGVVIIGDFKLGSSPFLLLRDVIDAPIFKVDPNFVPKDGNGLNPLLQNYWMVIHPPTLFLGFATTLVPFAYCISGLALGNFSKWIRPALPWTIVSCLILGVGILMGAYWAYETLNFGGYWNWDPVENAVYVPWLVEVASIHMMISFKKSNTALKAAIILSISTFILILYSTFLTRSGILGNSSVHSFTDLGLSGQLLFYLLLFVGISFVLCLIAWKRIPTSEDQTSVYSREFWIFLGATVLCLMAFQVIIPTSIPVFNAIMSMVGVKSNLAPPVDQVGFYTSFQLGLAIFLALLSGTGQFFWWKNANRKAVWDSLKLPIVISLFVSATVIALLKVSQWEYIILLIASSYTIIANAKIFISLVKTNLNLSGGALAHMGVGLMLLGILFSSGYSKIVSKNNTGLLWSKEFPDEVNQNNLLLFLDEPREMNGYTVNYKGIRKKVYDFPGYIPESHLDPTQNSQFLIAKKAIITNNKTYFDIGDTVKVINPENSYFEISLKKGGSSFTLFPRVQLNETMDMIVYSPAIDHRFEADLYTHVRTFPDPKEEDKWDEGKVLRLKVGEQFFINDFVAVFEKVQRIRKIEGLVLEEEDIAVQAEIKVMGTTDQYIMNPIYVIKNNRAGKIASELAEVAAKITLEEIDPPNNQFVFKVNTSQKDWVIIEALEKPYINLLWIGTIVLILGFSIAIQRRYSEFQKMKLKGLE